MSYFDAITELPDGMFDETCSIEKGPVFATVSGMGALPCTIDPISGNAGMMLFALQSGATHTINLQTYQPTIESGMRAKIRSEYYPILRAFHNDGLFTVLIVQGTKPNQ